MRTSEGHDVATFYIMDNFTLDPDDQGEFGIDEDLTVSSSTHEVLLKSGVYMVDPTPGTFVDENNVTHAYYGTVNIDTYCVEI